MTVHQEWFREHLLAEILPRWREAPITPEGAFLPRLDRQWRPRAEQMVTLVSQSRLLFNHAQGYALTGDPAHLSRVEAGARFLVTSLRDAEHGGWFWSCTPEGRIPDERKDTYGHAFVLFGLAHAFQTTQDPAFREAALHAWETLDTRLSDGSGGFVLSTTRDFTTRSRGRSINPLMHLFEALLAASAFEPGLRGEAGRVADHVLAQARPQDGLLPELYTDDWTPRPTDEGGYIDLGHAFEWAFLLSSAAEQGLTEGYLDAARRLLEGGMRLGLDPDTGGVFSGATMEAATRGAGKGWWQQCEAIRALLHHAVVRGRKDLWTPLERLVGFARHHFVDPEYGGWYGSLTPEGTPSSTDKGSEWKVDYHVVGMCVEALRLERF